MTDRDVEMRAVATHSRARNVRSPSSAYHDEADRYDHRTRAFHHWRELLIDELPVTSGDTVLDIGCGTGLCLPLLHRKVGPTGHIVGIDGSSDMIELASRRVEGHGWQNVDLIAASVDVAPISIAAADAVVFCAVHDVLQSRAALENIFRHVRPGAHIAAIGGKWPAPWLWGLRPWVENLHRPFVDDFAGFDEPWRMLAEFVPDLAVQQLAAGTGYRAHGRTAST